MGQVGRVRDMGISPSDWLVQHLDLIDRSRPVLDIASGRGRHAVMLAADGYDVHAIDRDGAALEALRAAAVDAGGSVRTTLLDLEEGIPDLGVEQSGTVLVFNYLHRPLFPSLIRALAPGGVLIYETFTIGQAERACPERAVASRPSTMLGATLSLPKGRRGHPRNPLFLLQPGELASLIAPLALVASREGDFNGKLLTSVVARKT